MDSNFNAQGELDVSGSNPDVPPFTEIAQQDRARKKKKLCLDETNPAILTLILWEDEVAGSSPALCDPRVSGGNKSLTCRGGKCH